jgi:hypothetical protein
MYPLSIIDPRFSTLQVGVERVVNRWAFEGSYGISTKIKTREFFRDPLSGHKIRLGVSWLYKQRKFNNQFLKLEYFHNEFRARAYDGWYEDLIDHGYVMFERAVSHFKAQGYLLSAGNRNYLDEKRKFFMDFSVGIGHRFVSNRFSEWENPRQYYRQRPYTHSREPHTNGDLQNVSFDVRWAFGITLFKK